MLVTLAIDVERQNRELEAREALLQDHYRDAYEQSQTSLLEVLLAADSFESVATQVGYLMTVSEQDAALADEIRVARARLESSRATLREGRAELADSRDEEEAEAATLRAQQQELSGLQAQLAQLKAQAEQKRAEQEAALNAALAAQGNVQQQIAANQAAAAAAAALVTKLLAESHVQISSRGFRWPEDNFIITQEWGPTSFALEPPYTYNGHYYPHFHGGIDIAHGCGTPIRAAGSGVVAASGQPLWPYDPGYGVVIDHGGGVMTWYWHLRAQVIVHPGQGVSPWRRDRLRGEHRLGHRLSPALRRQRPRGVDQPALVPAVAPRGGRRPGRLRPEARSPRWPRRWGDRVRSRSRPGADPS